MSLFEELKRRRVFRLIAAYVVVAWVLIQVVTAIEEPLNLPDWFDTAVIVLLGIGFPIAVIMSWVYDVTPEGVVHEDGDPRPVQIDYGKIALGAVIVLGAFLAGNYLTTTVPTGAENPDADSGGQAQRYRIGVTSTNGPVVSQFATAGISPDGQTYVIANRDNPEAWRLMSRRADELLFQNIEGTENARDAFAFSPDGKQIIFQDLVDHTIKRIPLEGGTATPVANTGATVPIRSITWGDNGDIVYANFEQPELYRLSSEGGDPEQITSPGEGLAHKHARFIPGTDMLMLTVGSLGRSANRADRLAFLKPDGELVVTETEGESPIPVSDEVVFYYNRNALWLASMDLPTFEIDGELTPVAEGVMYDTRAIFDVSREGSLVYRQDFRLERNAVVWVDRDGKEEPIPFPPGNYETPRIAPTGDRIAVIRRTPYGPDIFIHAANGRELFQLTNEESWEQFPVWSPDGSTLYFTQERVDQLYRAIVESGSQPERLTDTTVRNETGSISPDGTELFYHTRTSGPAKPDLAVLDLQEMQSRVLLKTDWQDVHPSISPDGNWLAYESSRTGQPEVWLRPWPNLDQGTWQVSTGGGKAPTWGDDSSELFYVSGDNSSVTSVHIEYEPDISFGESTALFDAGRYDHSGTGYYDRNSRRFLLTTHSFDPQQDQTEIIVVRNWPKLLSQQKY